MAHWPLMGGLLHLVQRRGERWHRALPSPLFAVPNVTAHPSTASVPTSCYLMWHWQYKVLKETKMTRQQRHFCEIGNNWTQLTVNGTTSSTCCWTRMLLVALEMFSAAAVIYANITSSSSSSSSLLQKNVIKSHGVKRKTSSNKQKQNNDTFGIQTVVLLLLSRPSSDEGWRQQTTTSLSSSSTVFCVLLSVSALHTCVQITVTCHHRGLP